MVFPSKPDWKSEDVTMTSEPKKIPWQLLQVRHAGGGRILTGRERQRVLKRWRNGGNVEGYEFLAPIPQPRGSWNGDLYTLVATVPPDFETAGAIPMIEMSREVINMLLHLAKRMEVTHQQAFEIALRRAVTEPKVTLPTPWDAVAPHTTEEPALELGLRHCQRLLFLAERDGTNPNEAFARAVRAAWTRL